MSERRKVLIPVKVCPSCSYWQRAWVIDGKMKHGCCTCGEPYRNFQLEPRKI